MKKGIKILLIISYCITMFILLSLIIFTAIIEQKLVFHFLWLPIAIISLAFISALRRDKKKMDNQ